MTTSLISPKNGSQINKKTKKFIFYLRGRRKKFNSICLPTEVNMDSG